ncbi:ADP-heptose:LPS heptosyltransferase [Saccharopolyspora erythraea NRRL 2338]|nr:ADP-heptose:LPS heptosyltransferase [Saccharopolyspora erythraea NRRL 2338]
MFVGGRVLAVTSTVLVLRALGLGDLLTAVPALRGLRRAHPGHRIVLAAPRGLGPLLPLVDAVDELHPTPDMREFDWPDAPVELAVNLHGSGPQSTTALRAARPRRLVTHANPALPDVEGPRWPSGEHEVRRWCRLLRHHGIPADHDDLRLRPPDATSPAPDAVVVHPGASHAARCWPRERFAALARWLAARGRRVVITGGAEERERAHQVAALADLPPESVLAGRTALPELAALVASARLVVCGDTGVAHLATGFGTPSVVLFGPVSPAEWGPPEDPNHVALWTGTVGDTFADEPDPGLLRLTTDEVIEAAAAQLDRCAAVPRGGPP